MKKILLTGSHGFVGTALRKQLYLYYTDSWDYKIRKNAKNISKRDLEDVDVVIHLAASISVPQSYENPHAYFENNTMLTLQLIDRAVKAGVKKFIFASSSSVYADPLSPYGASKLSAEHALDIYKDRIELYRLRFFNLYGAGQNREFPGVITKIIDSIMNGKPFVINGDGLQTRSYTYVEDIVKIILRIIESKERLISDFPVDISSGESISLNDLIEKIEKITGLQLDKRHGPQLREIKHSSGIKAPGELIKQFTPIDKGLEATVAEVIAQYINVNGKQMKRNAK